MEAEKSLACKRAARDQRVLDYIEDFWTENETAPTLEQIRVGVDRKSKAGILYTCRRLVKADKLRVIWVQYGKRRGYQVMPDDGQE